MVMDIGKHIGCINRIGNRHIKDSRQCRWEFWIEVRHITSSLGINWLSFGERLIKLD